MTHRFDTTRWQNHSARRVGQAHMQRIIQATVNPGHPDYQDIEARRQARYGESGPASRAFGHNGSSE
jgi:hypothetical protein